MKKDDIEYSIEFARQKFKNNDFAASEKIYKTIWENSEKKDLFLLFEYGKTLRKLKKGKIFIDICKSINEISHPLDDMRIMSLLCWCLYDVYIKDYIYLENEKEKFEKFISIAQYIVEHIKQLSVKEYYLNPYIFTVKKVVKVYLTRSVPNYNEIIKWLRYLNPDILPEEDYKCKDLKGKERELASFKEFYYQNMAKAYEKIENYKECINNCQIALNEIKKFHYKNKTWITARLYFCKCMESENIDEDIKKYAEIAEREKFWFMFHKLSQICFIYNKIEDSLFYASKAICCKYEYEKMVKLFLDIALLWEIFDSTKVKSKLFFQASAYYREHNGWKIPDELQYYTNFYNIDIFIKPDVEKIINISKEYVQEKEQEFEGRIECFLPHGCAGFIKQEHSKENIYFNKHEVVNSENINIGDKVTYIIEKKANGKQAAKHIKRIGDKR